MSMIDDVARDLGFEDSREMFELIHSVDISTNDRLQLFNEWREKDATKAGLLALKELHKGETRIRTYPKGEYHYVTDLAFHIGISARPVYRDKNGDLWEADLARDDMEVWFYKVTDKPEYKQYLKGETKNEQDQ